ncbi:MAG: nucleoside-diphosphate kinase [Tenuifilaceae bacterium]
MNTKYTFAMIKPDSFKKGYTSDILYEILKDGFKLRAIKITMLTLEKAEQFYEEHRGKEFFERLTCFMSSGPVMALILEKPDAINEYRKLIGKTDPAQAQEGTIRHKYGTSTTFNAVHGADSFEHAEREWSFFFSKREIY